MRRVRSRFSTKSPKGAAGGFTLPEVLVTLSLATVFMLLATRLLYAMNGQAFGARAAHASAASLDHLTARLRADAWAATAIEVPDPRTARLRPAEGSAVVWHVEEDGAVTRTEQVAGAVNDASAPPATAVGATEPTSAPMTEPTSMPTTVEAGVPTTAPAATRWEPGLEVRFGVAANGSALALTAAPPGHPDAADTAVLVSQMMLAAKEGR